MAERYAALDRSNKNAARVAGLFFLPLFAALSIGFLFDEDRRTSPTTGRGIYALGLPGWIVDGAAALLFIAWTAFIIVGWVRENKRRRNSSHGDTAGTDAPASD